MTIEHQKSLYTTNFKFFIRKVFEHLNPGQVYNHNWHIDYIADKLQMVTDGKLPRLIINLPPRSLKSTIVSVAWTAWLMAKIPQMRIMASSYCSSLSTKHSLDTRSVMESDWYKESFPETVLAKDQNEKHKFMTTKRGCRFATSVGGSATGEGADVLIVDDPHNPMHMASPLKRSNTLLWYDQVYSTRLDNKKLGAIVVVMQRLHVDDLTAHLVEQGGWEVISLPAIFEESRVFEYEDKKKVVNVCGFLHENREGAKEILAAKRVLGTAGFNAQYMQNPLPATGGMVEKDWLRRWEEGVMSLESEGEEVSTSLRAAGEAIHPSPSLWIASASLRNDGLTRITQSWDTAVKVGNGNDYSVCSTWEERADGHYLLDVTAVQEPYPRLKKLCVGLAEKWQPQAILIEDKASGQSLLQDLRSSTRLPLIGVNPVQDKITRFARVTALFEAGKVFLPKYAPWLHDYETQIFSFPGGSHDDMVDSTSQYLNWARRRDGPRVRRL